MEGLELDSKEIGLLRIIKIDKELARKLVAQNPKEKLDCVVCKIISERVLALHTKEKQV